MGRDVTTATTLDILKSIDPANYGWFKNNAVNGFATAISGLSAYQTGLGKDVRGEGLIGLTRGFMYSGASGVVASLWKVDDEATAELMKNFYAGMFEKELSPSVALREAQLALRQQKRWQEPYYWAGFVIQGQYVKGGRGNSVTPAMKVGALSAVVGILLCVVYLAIRRRRKGIL